ncbi:protein of unknown function [Candidatus Filomicrobium marinum]|uniref:Uncharacterized protein n=1 Tax=Candidatus Filomicrobium marinum TaxID=1608628 RepID=A0A0D6JGX9_9HYPH|nr:protein of unknown function [Candidatus Filomicrobium marinum]CPR19926.1 protein of unknown function [Candidatus Filomicrobium marinum]
MQVGDGCLKALWECAAQTVGTDCKYWLGRQDSNLGMAVPKTAALPLGYAPSDRMVFYSVFAGFQVRQTRGWALKKGRTPSLYFVSHLGRPFGRPAKMKPINSPVAC